MTIRGEQYGFIPQKRKSTIMLHLRVETCLPQNKNVESRRRASLHLLLRNPLTLTFLPILQAILAVTRSRLLNISTTIMRQRLPTPLTPNRLERNRHHNIRHIIVVVTTFHIGFAWFTFSRLYYVNRQF